MNQILHFGLDEKAITLEFYIVMYGGWILSILVLLSLEKNLIS
ncbi:hypothetical protein COLU111180_13715 [Cohnella lubricantis]